MSHPSRGAWIEMSKTVASSVKTTPSHPSRGAWIEMDIPPPMRTSRSCRTPHGVRGLKYLHGAHDVHQFSRTPHGVRGLKYVGAGDIHAGVKSHPSRGAWIEMCRPQPYPHQLCGRTPHGVRGLKFLVVGDVRAVVRVAPLTGCVD